ncbi:hypothetical protein NEOLEDRAFT_961831 [Neolentinus lepideus HHB14362 ss-1]|uniref:G-protein coupled receptors family 1 profile domain-containing protein n=1 Tax=Neolentinus lepideus HHB14362 ss-1 TaxID=1314782 RepID=A0A165UGU1_9AGAM|nr:hypothetical protein NEOLEDRAFT_961831 [Neolentinus lepideus HHB14362 ss-1]
MVNWKDPDVIANQTVTFVHFVHILGGLYLAEVLLRFPFEWDVYTRKRALRWTTLVYIFSRWLMLVDLGVFLAILNVKTEVNCMVAFKVVIALGNIAVGLASLLLMIRAVAINAAKKKYLIPLIAILLANWATLLHAVDVADAAWDPQSSSCSIKGTHSFALNILVSFCADFVFMGVTFSALMQKEGVSRLWRLLYREGLVCMTVAAAAYLIPSVFVLLNFNDIMNYMFQPFASIVMVTCSTRMYRELSEFLTPSILPTHTAASLTTIEFYKPGGKISSSRQGTMSVKIEMETVMETTTETDSSVATNRTMVNQSPV